MSTQVSIPGYVAGTWVIDSAHSDVSFWVRLLGFTKVRGTFDDFEGTIVLAEDPLDSSVNAVIKSVSVNTRNPRRDKDLQKDDYLGSEQYPTITFASTGVRVDGDSFLVDGDLTIRAVTQQVTLNLEPKGFGEGADGSPQAKFAASTEVSSAAFGVTLGKAKAVIGDKNTVTLDIEATRQA